MPDQDPIARLDAFGDRAGAEVPPLPAELIRAVGARGAMQPVARQSVPRVAMAAAAAVVLAGAALVALRAPVVTRGGGGGGGGVWPVAGLPGSASMLAMTERFNRAGSIDAALEVQSVSGVHGSAVVSPVYRALDARTGLLPE